MVARHPSNHEICGQKTWVWGSSPLHNKTPGLPEYLVKPPLMALVTDSAFISEPDCRGGVGKSRWNACLDGLVPTRSA